MFESHNYLVKYSMRIQLVSYLKKKYFLSFDFDKIILSVVTDTFKIT